MFKKYIFHLHTFLLIYIVAGFVWWYLLIDAQNTEIANLKLQLGEPKNQIVEFEQRKRNQYLSEGFFLLGVILTGSFFIYRILKREFYITKKEKNFLLGITHELKTPITTIMLNLETLQKRKSEEHVKKMLIHDAIEELKRLNNFYDNIMMSAQFEDKSIDTNFEKIDLATVLNFVLKDYTRQNVEIIATLNNQNFFVQGDFHLLALCFRNIIENAIKYSLNEKKIVVKAYSKNKKHFFEFIDFGVGIPDKEKKNVFYKFYRVGAEITRTTQGSGLGLFIVKKIVLQHKAKIELLNNIPQGTIVKIVFNEKA